MELKDFKLIKNHQNPEMCFKYEMKDNDRRFLMFTINYGKTFLASVEYLDGNWKWRTETERHFDKIDDAVTFLRFHFFIR